MSIEISSESLLSFAEAARRLPGRPNISTLHRWRLHGIRGVKLESALIGGRRYTSVEALERFSMRMTSVAEGKPIPLRSERQRQKAIDRAMGKVCPRDFKSDRP
ncbi:DUF1580 domain-containing protein [Blastopirellula sp. JC732]|uniref:DUF1580 domain-containing protein n=1 Tax=Blastopirellula sediminis TaxID=2894196 RepID=A0A9X1MLX2_9BACT|nr:DUF1580 domain-containing protein [Blastopirellula sediminis]MCC9608553.1 DUF1580 domain-containing protein [Blastopirellula sediminis]MCC9628670.1 DUF1580 domain-containing protein [Blastopirellula sediminis]